MQEGVVANDKMKAFLKNNMLGQLGRFGFSLFTSSVESLKKRFARKPRDLVLGDAQREEKVKEQRRIKKAIEYKMLLREAFDFFSKNSATIEVVRNQQIEKVQFLLLPFCLELPKVWCDLIFT